MKNSTILIVAGIAIAAISIGIVLMDNAKTNDVHVKNVQMNNGQVGEPKDKPRLVNLDDVAQAANNAYKPRPPRVNPVMLFLFGMIVFVVGVYDARRTPSTEKEKSPG